MQKFDIVIIGSGLGGLICGYILSKEGYNICIIEKENQLGGCLQTFKRNGCTFDTGMHYIGSMEEGQTLNRYFKYFGLTDKLNLFRLDENGYDIINYQGEDFAFAQGHDNFVDTLHRKFPKEKKALVDYTNKLKEISSNIDLYNLRETPETPSGNGHFLTIGVHDYLQSITKDVKLQNVLAGSSPLYAGIREKSPLYVHAIINNSFIESAWRFVDGGSQIANILADRIRENGGTILNKTEVTKIVEQDGLIKHVIINNSEQIEASKFISNIHPEKTLSMLDSSMIRKAYRNRISSLENTIGMFTVYIVLKENTIKYFNNNIYHYAIDDVWAGPGYRNENWPEGCMILTAPSKGMGEYTNNLSIITYMRWDEMLPWENTDIEKRGDDYLAFKEKKAQQLIDLVEKQIPGLKQSIKTYYTSTPLTYRDYTGTKEGSVYGILKDYNDPIKTLIFPRTRIPNLLFTGQNTNTHGVLGVTLGAVMTSATITGLNYLIKKINEA